MTNQTDPKMLDMAREILEIAYEKAMLKNYDNPDKEIISAFAQALSQLQSETRERTIEEAAKVAESMIDVQVKNGFKTYGRGAQEIAQAIRNLKCEKA